LVRIDLFPETVQVFQYVLLTCLAEQHGVISNAVSTRCVGAIVLQLSSHRSVVPCGTMRSLKFANQGTQRNPKLKLSSFEKAAILLLCRIRLTDPSSEQLLLSSKEPINM
jgi:hypothetical protein